MEAPVQSGSSKASGQLRSSGWLWLTAVALAVATLFAFWPVLQCDFLHLDDPDYVTENPHVRSGLTWSGVWWAFTTLHASNWHPMTWLSLMADVDLYGVSAGGMHFTNLVLHTANVLLVFALVRSLTESHGRAVFVAAFFGVHPLRVESVAWISERKDVLAVFFGLLCLLSYVYYAKGRLGGDTSSSRRWLLGSVGCFALGLMSKPVLVTLPFVLLLLDYWPLRRMQGFADAKALLREKWPFLLLAFASSVMTLAAQNSGQAVQSLADYPFWERVGNSFVSYARYAGKTVWPNGMAVLYPYPNWPVAVVVLAVVGLIAALMLAISLRKRRPYLSVGIFMCVGTLVPMIGLVQVGGQSMADRYTYLPHLGFWLAVVLLGYEIAAEHKWARAAVMTGSGAALLVCVVLTRQQISHWTNTEELLRHAIQATGKNSLAYFSLGAFYQSAGKMENAADCYQRILEFEPNNVHAHDRLAAICLDQGDSEKALAHYKAILQIQPDSGIAFNSYGATLVRQGRIDDAVSAFQRALELKPDYAEAHYNLALVQATQRRFDEAIPHFLAAERVMPQALTCNNLGLALAAVQREDEAISAYRRAVELDPKMLEAWVNLGNVLARKHDFDGALNNYGRALKLNSNNAALLNNIGHVLLQTGRLDEAISNFDAALQINPQFPQARFNLAEALTRQRKPALAVEQFQKLLLEGNENPQVYFGKARALLDVGKTNEASLALQRALRLNPDYPEASELFRALNSASAADP